MSLEQRVIFATMLWGDHGGIEMTK